MVLVLIRLFVELNFCSFRNSQKKHLIVDTVAELFETINKTARIRAKP